MVFLDGVSRPRASTYPNTHTKIASPPLQVEFRLVGEIPTSGLPTVRPVFRFVLAQRHFPELGRLRSDLEPTRVICDPLEGKFQV